jgi:excinuclease ABC subunit A
LAKTIEDPNNITIKGARVHNLQNIDVKIPKNKFVVITGVSGSGKSSLAFDTLFAEGQRRYVSSLSSYARQFLELTDKPDVDLITGLSPAISIDQKTASRNPRSTVGTTTEVNDYLRLLYARVGTPHCPNCGRVVEAQTVQQIVDSIIKRSKKTHNRNIQILAPIVKDRKGRYEELFERLLSDGFLRVRVDNKIHHLEEDIKLKRYEKHTIELVVDRLQRDKKYSKDKLRDFEKRLTDSTETALNKSEGEILVLIGDKEFFYSEENSCPQCGISFPKLEPHSFSFNSPHGACAKCGGLGSIKEVDVKTTYNPNLTIREGGIFPWSKQTTRDSWTLRILEKVAEDHKFNLRTKIGKYPKGIFDLIFYGKNSHKSYRIRYKNKYGRTNTYDTKFEGLIPQIKRRYKETDSEYARQEYEKYMIDQKCDVCQGKRLSATSLAVTVGDKNIAEVLDMTVNHVIKWSKSIKFDKTKAQIAKPILKEITERLTFLTNVGLEYLTLSRNARTLSGGEAQRIRLASQIGTGLTGILYVLDEPSIGLHARDMDRLLSTLTNLRNLGNTVIVVEHDENTIRSADWIIDMGPGAGENGGKIISEGKIEKIIKDSKSLTGQYLSGKKRVDIQSEKMKLPNGKYFEILGASQHNLKNIDVKIPLGKLVAVTGVSGSGKSTLVNDTLYKILVNNLQNGKQKPGKYYSLKGLENIDKVINIDQSPIGRTPRSNPATYTGAFTPIRELFAQTKEARERGYKMGRFSFNVKGGRCENCRGDGQIKIEMQFLPDMYVMCQECKGKRYNRDVLQIDYKDKNISDVLNMTVSEALRFFSSIPQIKRKLQTLDDVGLGYIRLGQPATTLSGGEAQRIKLASELSKRARGHTMYILDEPTTGLHFDDISKLIQVLHRLVDKGHSVIMIEHNLDVIRSCDWVIDLGPEGGDRGGKIVAEGTVEQIMNNKKSVTGQALKEK